MKIAISIDNLIKEIYARVALDAFSTDDSPVLGREQEPALREVLHGVAREVGVFLMPAVLDLDVSDRDIVTFTLDESVSRNNAAAPLFERAIASVMAGASLRVVMAGGAAAGSIPAALADYEGMLRDLRTLALSTTMYSIKAYDY